MSGADSIDAKKSVPVVVSAIGVIPPPIDQDCDAVAAVDHVAARAAVQNVASVAAVQGVIAIVAPEVADRPRTRRIIEVVVVRPAIGRLRGFLVLRSEEHKSELQSLMRISYSDFCLKKKTNKTRLTIPHRVL